ncbi:MAG TPA: alginate lyase family protein [Steroidobacteraceae bacterium]|nr:alginate lyase family protein [Steroidobacteraceae bacterium]
MQSLSWYVYRLRRMSPMELCYRAVQMGRARASRFAPPRPHAIPEPQFKAPVNFIHRDAGVAAAPYVMQAERVIEGRYRIFDLDECELGHPPEWNRDPLTGKRAPLTHAATLDYRDERLVGNIKYLWEPSRHLHIPTLAQAYALTGDERYATALRVHIDSWLEQCPPDVGAHWTSSLELAIRLINWSIAWQLIGGYESSLFDDDEGREFRGRWLKSVYLQTRAITRKLSRFSSANNHLIGEAAGVWIAAVTWDCWPEMRRWGERCRAILEEEVLKQNGTDGANREQAFSYQQFVLDFALIAGLAARASQHDFSAEYWTRIERMIDFIASMMDANNHMPMIGDADDGYVVSLAANPQHDNYQSLLATGAVLFHRSDLARKAGVCDDKTSWLLGRAGQRTFDALLAKAPLRYTGSRAFVEAGYYLLGDRYETPDEVRMVVDAGPLGYLSIAAHGHADALSFVLSVGGEEVLIDPGTYAYHTSPEWRRYFRGTRAHNTILVDDRDQSDQSGNFMWSRHANARCLEFLDELPVQRFVGDHDGYRALRDPLTHQRKIEYDAQQRKFTVEDTLDCKSKHTVRLHWHCSEHLQPIATDKEVCLYTDRHRVRIIAERAPDRVLTYRGGTDREGGWVSRGFGRKQPTTTIGWESLIEGRTVIRTDIYVDEEVG